MAELTIEQKAKRYDEIIEKAKSKIKNDKDHVLYEDDVIEMLPELKESEGERIRKELTDFIKRKFENSCSPTPSKSILAKWIAYLEKQGTSYTKKDVDDAYLEGMCVAKHELEKQDEKTSDKIVEKAKTEKQRVLLTETDGVANIDWDTRSLQDVKMLLEYGLDYIKKLEKQGKQKLPIEKLPSEMITPEESLGISSEKYNDIVNECLYGESKAEWKQENVEELSEFENAIMHIGYSFFGKRGGLDPNDTSSVKVQAQYLLELAQKPAEWSEGDDDDAWMNDIISKAENNLQLNKAEIDWLKSLKKRCAWKPSDEQITVLELASKYERVFTLKQIDILIGLKEQLKKLKGE